MPTPPVFLLTRLGLAAVALVCVALVSQYVFGLKPCHLCLWQRVPYVAMGVLAALGLAFTSPKFQRGLFTAMLVALVLEVGLAAYHSAVERHWVEGPGSCTGLEAKTMSVEQLHAQILGAAMVRCDEPTWILPGITMANANLVAALALLAYAIQRRKDVA